MGKESGTTIFSTKNGIVALDSPVKLKILELLKDGVTSFDELVEESGKAKSTISVHLNGLKNLNLIEEKTLTDDKRKKYFVLNSIYLAFSGEPLKRQYCKHLNEITNEELEKNSFLLHIFRTFRYGMEAYGFDPKPIMKKLGNDLGTKVGPWFNSNDTDGILKELSIFWTNQNLGNMTIVNDEIFIKNCYHCCKMPDVGKTLCSMDEGLMEGIFLSKLDIDYIFTEIECYGTGHNHCRYIFEKKNNLD